MARRTEIKLDKERIIAAAFDIVESSGLDGLTIRALASHLNVKGPALYWHFKDKAALLSAMAATIYVRARQSVSEFDSWREWLVGYGQSFRTELIKYNDGIQLCSIASGPSDPVSADAAQIAAPLLVRGLQQDDALTCIAAVTSLTLGWSIYQFSSPMSVQLNHLFDMNVAFEVALSAMVEGLSPKSIMA